VVDEVEGCFISSDISDDKKAPNLE